MKKLLLVMLLAACLVSCDALLDLILNDDAPLEQDQFYTVNFTNNSFYKVRATKLYEGTSCVIWAENSSGVDVATAQKFADKYDGIIRPTIVDAFGMKDFTYKGTTFKDILDYANWLVGKENKKLTILLLDIKDNFNIATNQSFVAGYFYSGNFDPRDTNKNNSNGCDMIFVDTNPSLSPLYPQLEQQTYATFAHELQHLINFATSTLKRKNSTGSYIPMDTWIDEGLSSQAEHLYYARNIDVGNTVDKKIFNGNIKEHYDRFIKDEKGTIAKGNNFFVWGNHTKEEPMAILDDYSTVYLFFRWLYLQANSRTSIFRNIEESALSDHTVITNVAKYINPAWADWDVLLRSWLAANYNPTNSNYGYKDNYFKDITVKTIKTTDNKISLYPGEGVYSRINSSFSPTAGGTYIRYAGLSSASSSSIAIQSPYTSNVLLTYNTNTKNNATPETGSLTGVSASVSPAPNSRMAIDTEQAETHTGPYIIDARDYAGILGRNK